MKYFSFFLLILIAFSLLLSPVLVTAADTSIGTSIQKNLGDVGTGAGFKSESETGGLPKLVGTIINAFLAILGVLFVVLIVYGGYTWMTSFGSEQKITKAKDVIISAVIGLIVLLAAYAISNFVVGALVTATVK